MTVTSREGTRFPSALQVQLDGAAVLQKLAVCSHNSCHHLFTFIPVVVSHQGHQAGGEERRTEFNLMEQTFSTKSSHKLTPCPVGQLGNFRAYMSALQILSARFLLCTNDILDVINGKKVKLRGRT